MKNLMHHPQFSPTSAGLSKKRFAPVPSAAPPHYVPLMAMSTRPQKCDGMSSSIAELMAA